MVAMAAFAAASELYLPIILCVFVSGSVVITSHAAAPTLSASNRVFCLKVTMRRVKFFVEGKK
jgi:hypothetical protein